MARNGRISKSTSSTVSAPVRRMSERQRSRLVAEASSQANTSAGAENSTVLEDMVNEVVPPMSRHDSFAMRLSFTAEQEAAEHAASQAISDIEMTEQIVEELKDIPVKHSQTMNACPITDKDEKPFPLMKLPPEIRNEIYRACLTRPFNILLSRQEPRFGIDVRKVDSEDEEQAENADDDQYSDSSSEDETIQVVARSQNADTNQETNNAPTAPPSASAGSSRGPRIQLRHLRDPRRSVSGRAAPMLPSSASSPPTISVATQGDTITVRPSEDEWRTAPKPGVMHRDMRPQDIDPLIVGLLRANKTVYNEARSILYSENCFTLDLETALPTLQLLHQRSRRQIKHVEVEIPCYNEILERFQETVRLSLRYCWGLKTLVIHMPFILPGADGSGTSGNTTVYANGFDILRWLPRPCEVVLKGNVCTEIEAVVRKNATLAKTLDELAYARRQLISNEGDRSSSR